MFGPEIDPETVINETSLFPGFAGWNRGRALPAVPCDRYVANANDY